MTQSKKLQFFFIAVLWLVLVYLMVVSSPVTLWTIFVIVASGVVVFVPLYKKYIRKK